MGSRDEYNNTNWEEESTWMRTISGLDAAGRTLLALSLFLFCMRLLHFYAISPQLGPKVLMVGRMVCNCAPDIKFLVPKHCHWIALIWVVITNESVEYANEANRIAHYAENSYKLGTRLELSESRFIQYGQSGRAPISHTSQRDTIELSRRYLKIYDVD